MQPKPTSTAVKGLAIGMILIVFSLVLHFMGLDTNNALQYIGYAIFVIGIIWSIMSYAKQVDYNAKFGKYFVHGFAITAIITCLMIIFMVVLISTDSTLKQTAMEKAAEEMHKNPRGMSDEQINQALEISKKFFTPMLLAGILLTYMFFGTIVSLITAAIAKKNPRPITDDDFDNNSLNPIG